MERSALSDSFESVRAREYAYTLDVLLAVIWQWFDCLTTLYLTSYGTQHEMNPLVRTILQEHVDMFILLKVIAAPLLIGLAGKAMWDAYADKEIQAFRFIHFINIVYAAVVFSNSLQMSLIRNGWQGF